MKFIIGKKMGMTQIFLSDGNVVPVTRVQAGPCPVAAVQKLSGRDAWSVQLGYGETKEWRLSKSVAGHLKGLGAVRELKTVTLDEAPTVQRGDVVNVETFVPGDSVSVIGTSKGRGFAGVVKRHHFRGGPASHGHKDNLRAPGSIGAGGVQRVFKGMRMAGRMGGARVTVKNLEIVAVNPESDELLIKGAIPGSRNALVLISAPGELKAARPNAAAEVAPVAEATTESTAPAQTDTPDVSA